MNAIKVAQPKILRDLESMGIELVFSGKPRLFLDSLIVHPTFLDEIRQVQTKDEEVKRIRENINEGKALRFVEDEQVVIRFRNRNCVPQGGDLKERIMAEAHNY